MNTRYQHGLTLIEILVAVAVFSLLAGAGYAALDQGLSIESRLNGQRQYWQALDATFSLLERDLSRVVDIGQRVPGGRAASFSGELDGSRNAAHEFLRFAANVPGNWRSTSPSPYESVSWRFNDGELRRASWPRLDAPYGARADVHVVLQDVESVRLRYLAAGGRWSRRWQLIGSGTPEPLPRALEITLETTRHERYVRKFHVGSTR